MTSLKDQPFFAAAHSTVTENIELTTAVTVVLVIAYLIYRQTGSLFWSHFNLPPGPRGLPIIGVLHRLSPPFTDTPHLTVQDWWKRYGDVMSFYMGSRLVVVVSGLEAMRECFIKNCAIFEGRPDSYLKRLTKGLGLVFTEGDTWKEHRRFAIGCLRDFGMGKIVLETTVHTEVRYLLEELSAGEGRPMDLSECIPKAVSNIICSIIYGSRFEYTDTIFKCNLEALRQSIRKQSLISLINFIPFLELLPKILPVDRMLERNVRMRDDYARTQFDEHRETFDAENPRDFIDAYMARMSLLKARNENTCLNESHLRRTIQDLFIAGTEPVSTTLRWALLFMAVHQDVQKQIQEELACVVGPGRLPSTKDRSMLPYTDATMLECQRLGNIALFNVPRAALQDTTVMGHHIPRGSWVFANRWGLHMSTKYWKNPEKFDPSRFLDVNGSVKKHEAFHPFGMGSRSCVGESLARTQLFIFFASILQTFTLTLPPNGTPPNLQPDVGLNLSPKPYELIIIRR